MRRHLNYFFKFITLIYLFSLNFGQPLYHARFTFDRKVIEWDDHINSAGVSDS